MHHRQLDQAIARKTRQCLSRSGRQGCGSFSARYVNLLLSLAGIIMVVTLINVVYGGQEELTLEARIARGEMLNDSQVPLIAETRQMHLAALKAEAAAATVTREIRSYARRFRIDLSLARLIFDISRDERMEPDLVFRVIWTESQFNPNCLGEVGEIGLMQVRYGTALLIDPGATTAKLFDPAYNIRIGVKCLKDHLHFYRGDLRLALLAYNRGRGRVNELLGMGIDPGNGYSNRVLETNL